MNQGLIDAVALAAAGTPELAHAASVTTNAASGTRTCKVRSLIGSPSMLNVHPALLRVALQHRVHDPHLRVAILERREVRRIATRLLPRRDVAVEVAEQVARAVRISLRMSAWIVCVAARVRIHQRWILDEDLVRLVAMPDPQVVRVLLIPRQRARAAVHLDPLPVLPPRAHL